MIAALFQNSRRCTDCAISAGSATRLPGSAPQPIRSAVVGIAGRRFRRASLPTASPSLSSRVPALCDRRRGRSLPCQCSFRRSCGRQCGGDIGQEMTARQNSRTLV